MNVRAERFLSDFKGRKTFQNPLDGTKQEFVYGNITFLNEGRHLLRKSRLLEKFNVQKMISDFG